MSYNLSTLYTVVNQVKPGFHISAGNTKTGAIHAWSLLPVVTCNGHKCPGCYAVKNCLCHGYDVEKNNCLKAWAENTKFVFDCEKTGDYTPFIDAMIDYFTPEINRPRFFRVHVSGDFFSKNYAAAWATIAGLFPDVRFLAFTKCYSNVEKVVFPANFQVVLSGWPGVDIPETLSGRLPIAFLDVPGYADYLDARRADALECPGNCITCGMCWNLSRTGHDVKFHKH